MTKQMRNNLNALEARGLTKTEAIEFYSLIARIYSTEEDKAQIEKEYNEAIPYEGGMTFIECITNLVKSIGI